MRKRIAVTLVASLVLALAAFGGFAVAGGLDKTADEVASARVIQRGAGFTPAAHAQGVVSYSGNLTRAMGFTDVTHPRTGTYCLKLVRGIKPSAYVAIVSPEYGLSPESDISAAWYLASNDCPSTRWVQVMTFAAGSPANEAFSIVIP